MDPARLAPFDGVLRPHRGHLLTGLLAVAGATVLAVFLPLGGLGIVMSVVLGISAGVGVVLVALSWRRVRFEVHGQEVHYHPALGRMRRFGPSNVAEVVHLNLRSPGSKASEWTTLLADHDGRRRLSVGTPLWPPAHLAPVLDPLVSAGATLTVVEEPTRVADLRPRYAAMLPWSRRHPGAVVAILLIVVLVLMVISSIVG
ncbi:hypothetical protein [Pseudactinotalea sp. Z1748]|uniref:hypothetical protein n=1 Tax=Pseudactinotalea sp. Z1748 TaxID=3413027 RepID=UPI003C7E8995